MSNSDESLEILRPGQVPTIPESAEEKAMQVRRATRSAVVEVVATVPDQLQRAHALVTKAKARALEPDPRAEDAVTEAASILARVIEEGIMWAARLTALCEEPQEPARKQDATQPRLDPFTIESSSAHEPRAVPPQRVLLPQFVQVGPGSI